MNYTEIREIPADLDFTKWNGRLDNYLGLYIDTRKAARDGIYKARSAKPKEFAEREHLTAMCENRLLILLHEAHKASPETYQRVLKKIIAGLPEKVVEEMLEAIKNPGDGSAFKPLAPRL